MTYDLAHLDPTHLISNKLWDGSGIDPSIGSGHLTRPTSAQTTFQVYRVGNTRFRVPH